MADAPPPPSAPPSAAACAPGGAAAGGAAAPQSQPQQQRRNLRVRTVTVFLHLEADEAKWAPELRAAGAFLARAAAALEAEGALPRRLTAAAGGGGSLGFFVWLLFERATVFPVAVPGCKAALPTAANIQQRQTPLSHLLPLPLPLSLSPPSPSGFEVQTTRVATQPFERFLGPPGPGLPAAAARLEALASANGVPMVALGGVCDEGYLPWIPVRRGRGGGGGCCCSQPFFLGGGGGLPLSLEPLEGGGGENFMCICKLGVAMRSKHHIP